MDPAPHARRPLDPTGQVTFLPTTDLAAVDAFYGDLLGLPLVRDQGVCRIYETSPGAHLGFCDRGYAVPGEFRVVLTLIVDDVAAAFHTLVARGATPEGPPSHSERYAATSFFVRDPNGYLLELQRFDVPLPAAGAGG
jgi:catechol 2,3-dioxygenase-like lactoylglutathione lyase family enzyme